LILCIDEDRRCADGDLPAGARVLRFRRHVPVGEVLRILATGSTRADAPSRHSP
jgi:hypothetical protein